MSTEANKTVYRRFMEEIVNSKNLDRSGSCHSIRSESASVVWLERLFVDVRYGLLAAQRQDAELSARVSELSEIKSTMLAM